MKTYIGVDLGTSCIKLSLVDELGNILNESKGYYSHQIDGLKSEQNPTEWWDSFEDTVEKLLDKQDRNFVSALSFSGQMHGLVILDKNNEVIRPCMLWNDGRSQKEVEYLNNEIGKTKLNEWTGNIAYAGFTLPKLLWVKNNESDNYQKINKIMLPKDYIVYRLTGKFVTDYSDASGTLMLDCQNKRWSKEILDLFNISLDKLPELHESYDFIGFVNDEFKKKHGLNNVKVIMGAGDNAAASVGMGVIDSNQINISLGTSGTIFIPTDNFIKTKNNELHSFASVTGKWHLMGCILTAASARKWWLEQIIGTSDYAQDEKDISNIKTNDLYFLPYLSGERSPHNDVNAKGAFIGLTHSTSKGAMSKAIMEGVAFALKDCLEIAINNGLSFEKATICGGGANSEIWSQLMADIFNMPIYRGEGSPSFGAALIAMKGDLNISFGDLTKLVKYNEQFFPNPENVHYYNKNYSIFKKLYPALKGVM